MYDFLPYLQWVERGKSRHKTVEQREEYVKLKEMNISMRMTYFMSRIFNISKNELIKGRKIKFISTNTYTCRIGCY